MCFSIFYRSTIDDIFAVDFSDELGFETTASVVKTTKLNSNNIVSSNSDSIPVMANSETQYLQPSTQQLLKIAARVHELDSFADDELDFSDSVLFLIFFN